MAVRNRHTAWKRVENSYHESLASKYVNYRRRPSRSERFATSREYRSFKVESWRVNLTNLMTLRASFASESAQKPVYLISASLARTLAERGFFSYDLQVYDDSYKARV